MAVTPPRYPTQAIREGSGEARAAASQRARGEAAPGAGRTGATKAVAKERVRPAAGAPGRFHERHATLRFARARCAACGHDFLVAFSCKGRGLCPSCTTRRMAETAAHLVDQVFPPLPVRQWVLAVPKRLRWYLEREPEALSAVLQFFLRVIERHLQHTSPGAAPGARFGAVSFVHRFWAALNRHVHLHCCVIDGVFEGGADGQVQFRPAQALTPEALAAIAAQVRQRVLRWFARSGLIEPNDPRDLLGWDKGGVSLDASARPDLVKRNVRYKESGYTAGRSLRSGFGRARPLTT